MPKPIIHNPNAEQTDYGLLRQLDRLSTESSCVFRNGTIYAQRVDRSVEIIEAILQDLSDVEASCKKIKEKLLLKKEKHHEEN